MRILRRPLSVALAALLSGSALVACGGDGEITVKGDGFSVTMPGATTREVLSARTSAGAVPITAYVTEGDEQGFSMSVLKLPKGVTGDLAGAVKGAASSVKGTLKDSRTTRHQGFPARDARITNAADENGTKGTVFARVILANGRVFQLQGVTSGADVKTPPAKYERFISSLKIG